MATEDQTEGDIASLAEKAARELLEVMPTLKLANPIERGMEISEALRAENSSAARLMAVFRDDSSFGNLHGGWIQQHGGFGMAAQGHAVPVLLINSVIDGHSTKSLIEEARAFAGSQTSITESYTPLAGATVAEAVSLDDNIDLVPWADVPDGNQKTVFGPGGAYDGLALLTSILRPMQAFANSAVRIRSADCQVLFSSSKDAEAAREASNRENNNRTVQIQDVVRCITVLSERPVAVLGNWAQFDKKIANDISGRGYSYNGALFENAVRAASSKPMALEGELIARLFHRFEEFKPSEKNVVRVSLDRLGQALRRQDIVDKAIDLGIALEVLLLHGIGKNDRGELRFRSSIRGATFLGGDRPERLKTLKLLKDAYDLRSKAVHSGVLKEEQKGPPPKQILEDATNICARIAQNLIHRGSFPDWNGEYVIGGQ